jgi:amidase
MLVGQHSAMTEPNDPALWPAYRQAEAIRQRTLSSRELLDAMLARVERLNPALNAVVTVDIERGNAAAAEADSATSAGRSAGPLHGLPMTIKDALWVAGMRSTGGARYRRDYVPAHDADAVTNVFTAGAFCFGKTNVPEWSGDVQTFNEVFGTTNNPWNIALTPGGSSGGPAVAVACGMTAFEIGTDIGGSIRIPSAFVGVAGHKPSYGLVPTGGYLDGPDGGLTEPDINVHGPIARSVEDLELALDVLASPAPDRAGAWSVRVPPARHARIGDYRVALWSDDDACRVSAETRVAVENAGAVLRAGGLTVDEHARPAFDPASTAAHASSLLGAAVTPSIADRTFIAIEATAHDATQRAEDRARADRYAIGHRRWLALDRERARIRMLWRDFFQEHDVLICPVTIRAPFAHNHDDDFSSRIIDVDGVARPYPDLIWWTTLIGAAYLPSTVVPVGQTADGLPLAVQVVGPYLEDRTCLVLARHLVTELDSLETPPMAR